MGLLKWLRHRHTWKPLKTVYRYKDYYTGDQITVKRCQCQGCGRIEFKHFNGKDLLN